MVKTCSKPPFTRASPLANLANLGQEPRHLVQIRTGQMTRQQGVLRPKTEAGPEICEVSYVRRHVAMFFYIQDIDGFTHRMKTWRS